MTLSASPLTLASPSPAPTAPTATGSRAALSSDFDMFLKLLTTQMRSQDPLNPADASEFASQLATFSAVEQQILSNETLSSILGALTTANPDTATGYLGAQVLTSQAVAFTGAPLEIEVDPVAGADSAVLVVTDTEGQVVARVPVPPDQEQVVWSGQAAAGPVPPGAYRFSVDSFSGQDLVGTQPGLAYGTVDEIRFDAGATRLVLAGGTTLSTTEVQGLRRAG